MCCCGSKKGLARDIAAVRKKPFFYDCFHNMGMTLSVAGIIFVSLCLIFILGLFTKFPTNRNHAGFGMYGDDLNIRFFLKNVPVELGSVVRTFHVLATSSCLSALLFLVYILFFRSYYRPEITMKVMTAVFNSASLFCMMVSASIWTWGTSDMIRNPIYVAFLWMVAALFLIPTVITMALICSNKLSQIYDEEISGDHDVSRIKYQTD